MASGPLTVMALSPLMTALPVVIEMVGWRQLYLHLICSLPHWKQCVNILKQGQAIGYCFAFSICQCNWAHIGFWYCGTCRVFSAALLRLSLRLINICNWCGKVQSNLDVSIYATYYACKHIEQWRNLLMNCRWRKTLCHPDVDIPAQIYVYLIEHCLYPWTLHCDYISSTAIV